MIKALIQGATPQEVLSLASHRLKASREEILDALQGDLSACHRFVLDEMMHHIEALEAQIARFENHLLDGLAPQQQGRIRQLSDVSCGLLQDIIEVRAQGVGGEVLFPESGRQLGDPGTGILADPLQDIVMPTYGRKMTLDNT